MLLPSFTTVLGDREMKMVLVFGAASALALALGGCGQKPSAVATQAPAAYGPSSETGSASETPSLGASTYASRAPVPMVDGKPMWAANRRHSAEENAQFQFAKNGEDFGARTETDYVAKAHAFVERPPSDTETIDRRNGDRLLYDPRQNVFAVVSRDGAPRTMFKPRDGATYWTQQKDRESKRSAPGSQGGDQS
jgi:pyocin large subunit-like protein